MPNPWINKIRLTVGTDNRTSTNFDIGTTFDKVRFSESNSYTLANFVEMIKTFFSKRMFMHYTSRNPNNNYNVVEWYEIGGEIPTGLDE